VFQTCNHCGGDTTSSHCGCVYSEISIFNLFADHKSVREEKEEGQAATDSWPVGHGLGISALWAVLAGKKGGTLLFNKLIVVVPAKDGENKGRGEASEVSARHYGACSSQATTTAVRQSFSATRCQECTMAKKACSKVEATNKVKMEIFPYVMDFASVFFHYLRTQPRFGPVPNIQISACGLPARYQITSPHERTAPEAKGARMVQQTREATTRR